MAQPAPIRILVGEDQPIVREGIVHVLADGGFEVVGIAGDARDLVRKARSGRPDVVVTDIQMPPDHADDGLRAALEIRSALPGVGVLVLSQFLEDRYASTWSPTVRRVSATCSRRRSATCACSPMPCGGSRTAGLRSTLTWSPAWWGAPAGAALSTG